MLDYINLHSFLRLIFYRIISMSPPILNLQYCAKIIEHQIENRYLLIFIAFLSDALNIYKQFKFK